MKKPILTFIFISMGVIACASAQTKTYKGAFFDIQYPSSFQAHGSMLSESAGDGSFDSVSFSSPDGEVEFYVHSPLFAGDADDIELKPSENLLKKQTIDGKEDGEIVIYRTIAAKDGSYTRTYKEIRNRYSKSTFTLGIKYKNQAGYDKYKNDYTAFQNSLRQFADH